MHTKTLSFILILSFVLFFTNSFAIKANLYWTTSWADIVTHMMGGMVVAGIIIFIHSFKGFSKSIRIRSLVILTIFIGVLWEIFELYNGLTILRDEGFVLDTVGDIFFDTLGAYLAYKFLTKGSNNK